MTGTTKRKKNRRSLIAFLALVAIFTTLGIREWKKMRALRSNYRQTTGTITEYVNQYGRAGGTYRYTFYVKDQRIESASGFTAVAKDRAHLLIGKSFPVFYNPVNPKNNQMLIFPVDFKWFGLPFPDSLEWVRAYER
jgi:hypothetical protein